MEPHDALVGYGRYSSHFGEGGDGSVDPPLLALLLPCQLPELIILPLLWLDFWEISSVVITISASY